MEKQRWEESERRSQEVRRAEKRKSEKKEDAGARKGRKVALHCVFPMICGSGWSTSRLAKRRVRSHLARWEIKHCTPLWREAHFEVKVYLRGTFRSWAVEKVHTVAARSTFPSQNVQDTKASDHFWQLRCRKSVRLAQSTFSSQKVHSTPALDHSWKLRCRKSARSCGAKHIFKSKRTKHTILRPFLEVEMSKKCTPLWREAQFQVKSVKTRGVRTTFESQDVEKVHAVVAQSTFPSQKCKKNWGFWDIFTFRCRKRAH